MVNRRQFLIGGGAAGATVLAGAGAFAAVQTGALPGRYRMAEWLGACGDTPVPPAVEPGPVVEGRFVSAARNGTEVGWSVRYPPGAVDGDRLPVCLALHGRGGSHRDPGEVLHLGRFLASGVTDGGVTPFVIASVDGGDAVNWHPRADGDDPVAMIDTELFPLLDGLGLDTTRPALWGWSLGGTGALYLAGTDLRPWAGAVAASPALWNGADEWAAGTYDGADDWAEASPWQRLSQLDGVPLRIDCGADDPLVDDVRAFRAALGPAPEGGIEPGCHDAAFWMRQAPAELAFVGELLAARS